jgi:chemotaxis protein methyltransferase CheR
MTSPATPPEPRIAVTLRPDQFVRLRDLLAEYGGVYLDVANQRSLETALAARVAATGLELERYERQIHAITGRDELRRLVELVLNHETFFFRNGPHLRALRETVFPEWHRRKPAGAPIRIWSAGCSTGEEPYSLALTALEALGMPPPRPIEIIGTDLSEPALQRARNAAYRGRSLNNVAPQMLDRYFMRLDDGYRLLPEVRALVSFRLFNLLDPIPTDLHGVDAIFCQNVTIYFQHETRRRLMARFYECLPEEGLLFLGFSETLWNVFDGFASRAIGDAYVYTKGAPARPAPARPAASNRIAHAPQRRAARAPAAPPPQPEVPPATELIAQAHELLDRGDTTAALELLRRVDPQSPHSPQAITLAARAHADRGDLELAAAEARRAIEIDPLNDTATLLIGIICSRLGEWAAAVQQLERARYLRPQSPLISFHLAGAYDQAGRTDLAQREYRSTLLKLEPYTPETMLDGVSVAWLRETCRRAIDSRRR